MTNTAPSAQIAAFYHFASVDSSKVDSFAELMEKKGEEMGLRGLIIFATEGVNGTISGLAKETVTAYLAWVSELLGFPTLTPKWSEAPTLPFRRFKVRVREEIVTLGKPEVQPLPPGSVTHLSPDDWDKMMTEEDSIVVDTRNWYETRVGKFKGALDPNIEDFQAFSKYLADGNVPKDKKVMIYCTGGIRCEKAIVEMHNQGFEQVYQLDGGILNYLAQKPNQNFEGECFVFDHRVAVDQNLKPSEIYKLCPHCGQPADQKIECGRCDTPAVICITCSDKSEEFHTCSKNCAYHFSLAPNKKGKVQEQGYKYR